MTSRDEEAVTTTYTIVVRSALSEDFVSDIGARSLEPSRGRTTIVVDIIDQSHLYSVLAWLQDRNIAIERVNPV